jgi:ribokinase
MSDKRRPARVSVVGSLNADHRVRVVRIPAAGETVLGSEIVVAAGGKGANQAVAAARAGATATIIGAIGDDSDGELVRRIVSEERVDARHVRIIPGTRTGRALITVDAHGENTIVVSPGANSLLTRDDVDAGLRDLGVGDLMLLQLETPEPLVRYTTRKAAEAGAVVVLNAAPVPTSIGGLLEHVALLVVNQHELTSIAKLLRGNGSAPATREDSMGLVASSCRTRVLCTAGGDGAFVTHEGRVDHVRAYPVDALDTTAAGDTFIGYLAAGLAADADDILGATETAVRASGIAVTRAGAIDAIPHRDEVRTTALTMKGRQ